MTDQAKEEYLVPGAKAHLFHSALERKIEIFTKRARNYLREVSKKLFLVGGQRVSLKWGAPSRWSFGPMVIWSRRASGRHTPL